MSTSRLQAVFNAGMILSLAGAVLSPLPASSDASRQTQPGLSSSAAGEYVPGRILVRFDPSARLSAAAGQVRTGQRGIDAALSQAGVIAARLLFPAEAGLGQHYLLELGLETDALAAAAQLAQQPGVAWAEPDWIARAAAPRLTPNDPLYPQQWGLTLVGAETAWESGTGSAETTIAVIDSGIDFSHPDLASQIWTNPGEIAANGLDDDNNGYVDDLHGWDFVNGDNDPSDDNGHGTQVAGVAAAAGNNSLGMAGMCWGCRIMPVKVMQAGGAANYSAIAAGVIYAAKKGVRVINLSLGGYSASSALQDAVQRAVNEYRAVVVAGAGNDDTSAPFYPAAYPEVLAVAGTGPLDIKTAISNYGDWVDLAAPAENIITTLDGSGYGSASGTSLAAAEVSGLAGLLRSLHPLWGPALIRSQMERTALSLDALNPGYAGWLGFGRMDAAQAATQAPHPLLSLASTAINGDPAGRPSPGSNAVLDVILRNEWLDASGVSAVLSTSDPFTSLTQASAMFGDLLSGAEAPGTPSFSFSVAAGAGYNHSIPFELQVSANDEAYTQTLSFSILTRSPEEPVGGTILADTTWTSDKTYIVNGNVGVTPGVTLTIQAGTVVKFNGSYSLNVGGTLIAAGTELAPIRMLPYTPGSSWGRIYLDDTSPDAITTSTGDYLGGSTLRWVDVEGAAGGIACSYTTPYISQVTLTRGGVSCVTGNTPLWFTHSDIMGGVSIQAGLAAPNSWATKASMPTARGVFGTATANGRIYAFGGYNGSALNLVEAYDWQADSWSTHAAMPTARWFLGAATADNGKVYAIGGQEGSQILDTVEEYDPVADAWEARTAMPTPRTALGVVAASNGKIYALGGSDGVSALDVVEEYDPATDTWASKAAMPTARASFGAVAAADGKIYAIGGWDGAGPLNTVEVYDPATDSWAAAAPMPTPRYTFGAAQMSNGLIFVLGGEAGGPILNVVEEYNPLTGSWTERPGMPTGRSGLGVAAISPDRLYTIGGGTPEATNIVEEFTLPADYLSYHLRDVSIHAGSLAAPAQSDLQSVVVEGALQAGGMGTTIQDALVGNGITINGSGLVLNSRSQGSVVLDSGTVQAVAVTGGNIELGSGLVLSNTIRGGGIVLGGGLVQGNDVENAPAWAVFSSGSSTVQGNRLVGNANGISVAGGLVQANLVAGNSGAGLEFNGETSVFTNTFTANAGSAIRVMPGAAAQIRANNLEFNSGAYDIENLSAEGIQASGNWWGTTDPVDIAQRIFDLYDDYTVGEVLFAAPALAPIPDAPAYVRSVTMSPESPVGIETASFEVQFSREMDPATAPLLSFGTLASTLQWQFGADMLTPRAKPGLAVVDGKIYAVAGDSLGTVEVFDPVSGSWTPGPAMLTPRYYSGVVALGGKIYAIGGYDQNGEDTGIAEVFDPATGSWAPLAPMPTPRVSFAIAVGSDGLIYAIGGVINDLETVSVVEAYDPAANAWYTRASLPAPRGWMEAETGLDGWIYVVGGLGPMGYEGVAAYNPQTNMWTPRASLLTPRHTHAVAQDAQGRIYALGGWDGGYLASVEVYDPQADAWTALPPLQQERSWVSAVNLGNRLYAIGGEHYGNLGTVERAELPYAAGDFYDESWLDETRFRARYDFNSLVPRSSYRLEVEAALGQDGIEIAPNSNYTFTVDYAGGVSDVTLPPAPLVTACAAVDPGTFSATWLAIDPESSIDLYSYAIGTSPGGAEVINWTTTASTEFQRSGLGLAPGQVVYISSRARNAGGLWSPAATPPGLAAGADRCTSTRVWLYLPLAWRP